MTKEEAAAVLLNALEQIYAGSWGVQSLVEQFDPILGMGDVEIYPGCEKAAEEGQPYGPRKPQVSLCCKNCGSTKIRRTAPQRPGEFRCGMCQAVGPAERVQ